MMQTQAVAELILAGILFVFSALFSAAETAIISLDRTGLTGRRGRKISKLLERPQELVCTFIIGYNLCNICSSIIVAHATWQLFGGGRSAAITGAYIVLVIALAEMLPKTVGIKNERLAYRLAPFAEAALFVFRPLARAISFVTGKIARRGDIARRYLHITEEEIVETILLAAKRGVLTRSEVDYITGVLRMDDIAVRDVRRRLSGFTVGASTPVTVAARVVSTNRHPFVIVRGAGGSILGYADAYDLVGGRGTVGKYVRRAITVGEDATLDVVLREMVESGVPVAVVVNRRGKPAGFVSAADIIERTLFHRRANNIYKGGA